MSVHGRKPKTFSVCSKDQHQASQQLHMPLPSDFIQFVMPSSATENHTQSRWGEQNLSMDSLIYD